MVYLDAACELLQKDETDRKLQPGGILYYHIDDPVLSSDGDMTESEAEHELLKALRPDGLVNSDGQILGAMDMNLEGRSDVIPVEQKKSGELSMAHSHVASTEEFEIMEQYARGKIAEIGRDIYEGRISVDPYRYKSECSCTYCPYASVCGVNSRIPGYGMRSVGSMSKEDIFEQMRTKIAREKAGKEETFGGVDEGTEKGY